MQSLLFINSVCELAEPQVLQSLLEFLHSGFLVPGKMLAIFVLSLFQGRKMREELFRIRSRSESSTLLYFFFEVISDDQTRD